MIYIWRFFLIKLVSIDSDKFNQYLYFTYFTLTQKKKIDKIPKSYF